MELKQRRAAVLACPPPPSSPLHQHLWDLSYVGLAQELLNGHQLAAEAHSAFQVSATLLLPTR